MARLLDRYDYETDDGMESTSNLESLLRGIPKGAGQSCPKCQRFAPLFFGDPDGEHWCMFCQMESELAAMAAEEATDA